MSAVLWDLDDTVLDTLPARMRSLDHAYTLCVGGKTDPEALWRSHRGATLEAMGERLLGKDGARFVTAYREHYYSQPKQVLPFEGVEAVLAHFHEHAIPMAIVTNKVSWGATEELQGTGLLQYFAAVVGVDDTEAGKPSAEPLLMALDRLVVDPGETVIMVGDSPADVLAGRNAGVRTVAATWGTIDRELLLDAAPDHVAEVPADVLTHYAVTTVQR